MVCPDSTSNRRRRCLAAVMGWLAAAQAVSAVPSDHPAGVDVAAAPGTAAALRQALQAATWPGDLVRLADDYLRQFAHLPEAADAAEIRRRAAVTARLLRTGEVQLFRSAFVLPSSVGLAAGDVRQAALGDAPAAWRLAQHLKDVSGTASAQIGWLQLAASLGHARASYELALHFRRQAQPMLASVYEQRAQSLGHPPPPALDHARK